MSARSVKANLHNNTGYYLQILPDSISLLHGEWTTYPPAQIAPGGTGTWQTDSDGFLTGTEGSLKYQFVDLRTTPASIQYVKCYWDDPYAGSNSYSITTSAADVKCSWSGGEGDNATVDYFAKAQ